MTSKSPALKFIFFLTFFLLIALSLRAQKLKSAVEEKEVNNDEEQLIILEYNWLKAEFALDTSYLSAIMDPGFIGISARGISQKNKELVDYYKIISERLKDSIVVDSFKLEEAMIKLYGSTAVVTFIVHTYIKDKGVTKQRRTRFYDVWIKRKNEWRAVASQGTKVLE